jgi:hypothetical protein
MGSFASLRKLHIRKVGVPQSIRYRRQFATSAAGKRGARNVEFLWIRRDRFCAWRWHTPVAWNPFPRGQNAASGVPFSGFSEQSWCRAPISVAAISIAKEETLALGEKAYDCSPAAVCAVVEGSKIDAPPLQQMRFRSVHNDIRSTCPSFFRNAW